MKKIKMDMTKGNILRQLIIFSLPLIATSVIQQFFNTADTIIVGRWGGSTIEEREIAVSAVGACSSVISLIINFFLGLSNGSSVLVSQAVGSKKYNSIKTIVHTAVCTSFVCGVILSVLGFTFSRSLLELVNTPDSVIDNATLYMQAYFLGVPAKLIYNYCAAMLRSVGDTTRPLLFLTISGVVNIILNIIMVTVFDLGALGVGIATAASETVACIMVIIYMMKNNGYCKLTIRKLRADMGVLKKLLSIGVPSGIQSTMFSIGNIIIQSALNSFNNSVYISASSIATSTYSYPHLVGSGFMSALQVFSGQNTGAKNIDRIKKGVRVDRILAIAVSGTGFLILNIFGKYIFDLFAPGNLPVIEFAQIKLAIMSLYFPLLFWEQSYAVSMKGMGKATMPMLASIIGTCGTRVAWIYTVFAVFRYPAVVFLAYPLSGMLTVIAQFILYKKTIKQLSLRFAEEQSNEITTT